MMDTTKTRQEAGNNSQNVQGGTVSVTNNIINNYLVVKSNEVGEALMNKTFGELPEETKKSLAKNQTSYTESLLEKTKNAKIENTPLMKGVVDSPDFQYSSKQALLSASKSSSKDLHNMLAGLVVGRLSHDSNDLKRVIYNEAIATVEKLTPNQIKIITLAFIVKYTSFTNVSCVEQLLSKLKEATEPYLDFRDTPSEFQHIAYTGCASFVPLSKEITPFIYENYRYLFRNEEVWDSEYKNLTKDARDFVDVVLKMIPIQNEDRLNSIKFDSDEKGGLVKKELIAFFNKVVLSNKEAEIKLCESEYFCSLKDKFSKTRIKSLILNSVGTLISLVNLEKSGNMPQLNIDTWIN